MRPLSPSSLQHLGYAMAGLGLEHALYSMTKRRAEEGLDEVRNTSESLERDSNLEKRNHPRQGWENLEKDENLRTRN